MLYIIIWYCSGLISIFLLTKHDTIVLERDYTLKNFIDDLPIFLIFAAIGPFMFFYFLSVIGATKLKKIKNKYGDISLIKYKKSELIKDEDDDEEYKIEVDLNNVEIDVSKKERW